MKKYVKCVFPTKIMFHKLYETLKLLDDFGEYKLEYQKIYEVDIVIVETVYRWDGGIDKIPFYKLKGVDFNMYACRFEDVDIGEIRKEKIKTILD